MSDMKLFVWADPYHVRYGSTMVFAIARDLDEARKVAATGSAYAYCEHSDRAPTNTALGEPTRVVDLPCAEWHMWQE